AAGRTPRGSPTPAALPSSRPVLTSDTRLGLSSPGRCPPSCRFSRHGLVSRKVYTAFPLFPHPLIMAPARWGASQRGPRRARRQEHERPRNRSVVCGAAGAAAAGRAVPAVLPARRAARLGRRRALGAVRDRRDLVVLVPPARLAADAGLSHGVRARIFVDGAAASARGAGGVGARDLARGGGAPRHVCRAARGSVGA